MLSLHSTFLFTLQTSVYAEYNDTTRLRIIVLRVRSIVFAK